MRANGSFDALMNQSGANTVGTILPPQSEYIITQIFARLKVQTSLTKRCHALCSDTKKTAFELTSLPPRRFSRCLTSLNLFTAVSACASAQSIQPPGSHQGFLAAGLAFPLGPVLIWVISTSARASGGRHERMRSMVFW